MEYVLTGVLLIVGMKQTSEVIALWLWLVCGCFVLEWATREQRSGRTVTFDLKWNYVDPLSSLRHRLVAIARRIHLCQRSPLTADHWPAYLQLLYVKLFTSSSQMDTVSFVSVYLKPLNSRSKMEWYVGRFSFVIFGIKWNQLNKNYYIFIKCFSNPFIKTVHAKHFSLNVWHIRV